MYNGTAEPSFESVGPHSVTHRLRLKAWIMSSDLGMRRRRAVWRATHRGSKEMDHLLGHYTEQTIDSMNADEIAVLERLIETADPQIELCLYEGYSLDDAELDALMARMRRFHGLPKAS